MYFYKNIHLKSYKRGQNKYYRHSIIFCQRANILELILSLNGVSPPLCQRLRDSWQDHSRIQASWRSLHPLQGVPDLFYCCCHLRVINICTVHCFNAFLGSEYFGEIRTVRDLEERSHSERLKDRVFVLLLVEQSIRDLKLYNSRIRIVSSSCSLLEVSSRSSSAV